MRVSVGSIEAFVATTIEELSGYRSDLIGKTLVRLVTDANVGFHKHEGHRQQTGQSPTEG